MKTLTSMLLMLLCGSILGSGGLLPPLPPKAFKHAQGVSRGDGAALLLSKRKLAQPKVAMKVMPGRCRLVWDWTPDSQGWAGIVFNVRSIRANPLFLPRGEWPIIATVTTNSWPFMIDKSARQVWFTVTASNVVTGKESL